MATLAEDELVTVQLFAHETGVSLEFTSAYHELDGELIAQRGQHAWSCLTVVASPSRLLMVPSTVLAMDKLTILALAGHDLSLVPPGIGGLTELEQLDLGNNRLHALPPEIGQLHKLRTLRIQNNKIMMLPVQLAHLDVLTELQAGGNAVRAMPRMLGEMANLAKLDLSKNQIHELHAAAERRILPQSLMWLDLSENDIGELAPWFAQLDGLTTLLLRDNPLRSINVLSGLKALTHLDVTNTQVAAIPRGLCVSAEKLTTLLMGGAPIEHLPPEFARLTALEHVIIQNVQFTPERGIYIQGELKYFLRFCGESSHQPLFAQAIEQLAQSHDVNSVDLIRIGAAGLLVNMLRHSTPVTRPPLIEALTVLFKLEHHKAQLLREGLLDVMGPLLLATEPVDADADADAATDGNVSYAASTRCRHMAAAAIAEACRNCTNYTTMAFVRFHGIELLSKLLEEKDAVVRSLAMRAAESLATPIPGTGYLYIQAIQSVQVTNSAGKMPAAPYCNFVIDDASFSTQCATDKQMPSWEGQQWCVGVADPIGRKLHVRIYDYKALYWDSLLGSATICLSEIMEADVVDLWVKVRPPVPEGTEDEPNPDAVCGKVHLMMQFVPKTSPELDAMARTNRAWSVEKPPPPPGGPSAHGPPRNPAERSARRVPLAIFPDASTLPATRETTNFSQLAAGVDSLFHKELFLALDVANAVYYRDKGKFLNGDCFDLDRVTFSNRHSDLSYVMAQTSSVHGDGATTYVGFAGVGSPADMLFQMKFVDNAHGKGNMHSGIAAIAERIPLLPLLEIIRPPRSALAPRRLILSGHGLGGTLAIATLIRLAYEGALAAEEIDRIRVVAFGSPFLGDEELASYVTRHGLAHVIHNVCNEGDIMAGIMATRPIRSGQRRCCESRRVLFDAARRRC